MLRCPNITRSFGPDPSMRFSRVYQRAKMRTKTGRDAGCELYVCGWPFIHIASALLLLCTECHPRPNGPIIVAAMPCEPRRDGRIAVDAAGECSRVFASRDGAEAVLPLRLLMLPKSRHCAAGQESQQS